MVDLGLAAGARVRDRAGDPAGDRRLRLAAAARAARRPGLPRVRRVSAASILCVSLYTAVKAAYLSTVFSTLDRGAEPDLPLAADAGRDGARLRVEAGSTGGSSRRDGVRRSSSCSSKPFQLGYPYFEAPGFAILDDRRTGTGTGTSRDLRLELVGAARRVARPARPAAAPRRRGGRGRAPARLDADVARSRRPSASTTSPTSSALTLPAAAQLGRPGHARASRSPTSARRSRTRTASGSTEFWNRSLRHVDSLDGSRPGPGPTGTPDIVSTDGTPLAHTGRQPYVLADSGVDAAGARRRDLGRRSSSTAQDGPWRLADAEQQVYSDGWAPHWSTYTYFRPSQRGTLDVTLSRTAYNGDAPSPAT